MPNWHRCFVTDPNGRSDGPTVDRLYWLGQAGDRPLVGDWNGDGRTEIGFFCNGCGCWTTTAIAAGTVP
jgi:hypothetical protein